MATENSLNNSMDSAKKHYSSMFTLPSYRKAILAIALVCVAGVSLSVFALFPSIGSLVLGLFLFAITFFADTVINKIILKADPIFSMRRTLVLSLVGWVFWLFFISVGVGLSFAFGSLLWVKLCLLGFAVVVALRFIVFNATSSASASRRLMSTLLQPALSIAAFLVFWVGYPGIATVTWQVILFVVAAPIIGFIAVSIFLSSIDRLGKNTYSLSALPLFRAFLLNWVTDQNAPLETHLEAMGEDKDIEVTLLKFDASKPKAAIIVPLVHPGPFKNIGSSLLPSLLKNSYEKEFGCDACVPLGILGHELDLASQAQNHKIVSQTIASARFGASADLASPLIRVTDGFATASCQIFGATAFLSFSLSPKTTEDLPQELGCLVAEEAKKYGLKNTVIVNTHNSITDIVDVEEHLESLQRAASKCLQKAVSQPTKPFMVGAATVFPKEFNLKAGMGTGGITAIIVQVEEQKTAYVVIDGNNMISGLREKLLAALASLGFDESEVFTTDTHAVSALVTGRRGYHPVGEVMDHELLIRYISEVTKKAESNLEACKTGCIHFVVPKVRVIGEERLRSVTGLVDKAIVKAKRIVAPIFGLELLVLVLLLLLF
jgi:putative membrane protein